MTTIDINKKCIHRDACMRQKGVSEGYNPDSSMSFACDTCIYCLEYDKPVEVVTVDTARKYAYDSQKYGYDPRKASSLDYPILFPMRIGDVLSLIHWQTP